MVRKKGKEEEREREKGRENAPIRRGFTVPESAHLCCFVVKNLFPIFQWIFSHGLKLFAILSKDRVKTRDLLITQRYRLEF